MKKEQNEYLEQNTVGLILKYYRERYRLNQNDICIGICSRTVLCRLESGIREIDSLTCETLLSRIGQEVNQFEIMLDDKDYENWFIRNRLVNQINTDDYKKFEESLEAYEKIMDKDNSLQCQFYLYCKIKYMIYRQENEKLIYKEVKRAISYTNPKKQKMKLYSKIELELAFIYNTTLRKVDDKKGKEIEQNLLELLEYVRSYHAKKQKQKIERFLLEELVTLWEEEKNYEAALKYLEELITVMRKQKVLYPLGNYFFKKVRLKEKIDGANLNRQECLEYCKMAYYIYLLWGKQEEAEELEKYCEEKIGCLTTNQEW